jgi:nucleotide-binding universal stress UspA family protein
LRSSPIPVLTLRTEDDVHAQPFATVIVAIDDSPPSDAAVTIAAAFANVALSKVIACGAVDTEAFYESASTYGFNVQRLADDLREDTRLLVRHALKHAGFRPETAADIVEGKPAPTIIDVAEEHHATLIIAGTHGRRGLRRLFLGSVAEQLVRTSRVPVLIVPAPSAGKLKMTSEVASSARSSTADRQAVPA